MAAAKEQQEMEKFFVESAEELKQLRARVVQLEAQEREHTSAAEIMSELPKDRRAFRLVGDVLVEQTVAESLESIKGNQEMIQKTMEESVKRTLEIENKVKEMSKTANASAQAPLIR
mmetsp:Transcript_9545/g.16734  ORF Transcript_9545/g.16734 Transcript_9545/m.16734 type:complete len:117 (+) Transcript_9545:270-620(+)